eukprot:TRINITY_DN5437_c0_g1_i2.p1 TRINITY_DN5437_c0_g1~~TRINITY_DN5437_c0_g1_i2.p1  ORF type:complete len:389 (+),score=45.36 TRINITY_DN5437_c0_g1_i2:57-1223(+)
MGMSDLARILITWVQCLSIARQFGCAHGESAWLEMLEWVVAEGGYVNPKLEMSTGPNPDQHLRGIFATSRIGYGETLARIPQRVCISSTTPCSVVDRLRAELVKGNASFFWPYLRQLESYVVEIPEVWSPAVLALLGDLPQAENTPTDWTRHSAWFESGCHGNMSDTFAVRAMLLYVTRANGKGDSYMLTPIYDSFNHRNGVYLNTKLSFDVWDDSLEESMFITARHDIEEGQQVYMSYGEGTLRNFRDYGFIEQFPQMWHLKPSENGNLSFLLGDTDKRVTFTPGTDFKAFASEASLLLMALTDAHEKQAPQSQRSRTETYQQAMPHLVIGDADARAKAQELRKTFVAAVRVARAAAVLNSRTESELLAATPDSSAASRLAHDSDEL